MCSLLEPGGVLKGIELGVVKVAKTMLDQGVDKDFIAKTTGLSMAEIDKL